VDPIKKTLTGGCAAHVGGAGGRGVLVAVGASALACGAVVSAGGAIRSVQTATMSLYKTDKLHAPLRDDRTDAVPPDTPYPKEFPQPAKPVAGVPKFIVLAGEYLETVARGLDKMGFRSNRGVAPPKQGKASGLGSRGTTSISSRSPISADRDAGYPVTTPRVGKTPNGNMRPIPTRAWRGHDRS